MPRLTTSVPQYRLHRPTGQAVVTIYGRHHYLGPWKSEASRLEYDRLIVEWVAAGRRTTVPEQRSEIKVEEVIADYWVFASVYYRKNGEVTREAGMIRDVMKVVRRLYGQTPADEFGPLRLKAVRQNLIDRGLARNTINKQIGRVVRMFKWAAGEEIVPGRIPENLRNVAGLKADRSPARESKPVPPVADAVVNETLEHCPPIVADMVRLQRLTGARPGEVRILRPRDVDRSGAVWLYRPESHKTQHHGRERIVCIGPRAQDVLRPYLLRADHDYCFDPRDTVRKLVADKHARRVTPLSCGNRPGSNRKTTPKRKAGDHYTSDSYRRAIARAVDAANKARTENDITEQLPTWKPNQLRHSAATEIRKTFGLEAAQVCLGHAAADVTQIYAERDLEKAAEVAARIG